MNSFYTLGYGRTTKLDFLVRLGEIQSELRKKLVLVDVRRNGCGSRNGVWCRHPGIERVTGLAGTIQDETEYGYIAMPRLGNNYGSSQRGLRKYQKDLVDGISSGEGYIYLSVDRLCKTIQESSNRAYILLCSERYAFRGMKSGQFNAAYESVDNTITQKPLCHRVILARELLKHLEKFSYVCHL